MPDYHDPVRHAETLSQVYAQDKRPLGLFMTAGCSFSVKDGATGRPLAPDIAGLTTAVRSMLRDEPKKTFERTLVALTSDGIEGISIEHVLTFIRSLSQVVGSEGVRGFSKAELDNLDIAVSESIASIVDVSLPQTQTPFDRVAKWIGSTKRAFPVELFTTNYDLLLERAMERNRIPFFDGFSGDEHAFFDPRSIEEDELPPRWARLWKLHGSINWQLDVDGNTMRTSTKEAARSRLIHPSHLKYSASRRMPYLAMIDRMRAFLKLPSAVVAICGYSFRDEHLNEVLLQGAEANRGTAVFALQYAALDEYPAAATIANACRNFSVFAQDAAVIGGSRAPWKTAQQQIVPSRSLGVFWNQETTAGDTELVGGNFLLGDFNSFGRFLSLLVGDEDDV